MVTLVTVGCVCVNGHCCVILPDSNSLLILASTLSAYSNFANTVKNIPKDMKLYK